MSSTVCPASSAQRPSFRIFRPGAAVRAAHRRRPAFIEHGTGKLLGFPHGLPFIDKMPTGLLYFTGTVELVGGALIVLGLFTRPVAFVLSGFMAVAYFLAHFPMSFFPAINFGEPAVLYCFVFLYIAAAGPSPSLFSTWPPKLVTAVDAASR